MGSNVMVLADSLHHDDMRNISANFGWSNTATFLDLIMKSLHATVTRDDTKIIGGGGRGLISCPDF